jgi:3-hydroxy-9,10-secoandrosta-1,3,5(10)-triene-9,17-dione monooxygenase reductase component
MCRSTVGSSVNGDPFATPAEMRDPARRLRGRLVSPVTVWTSGAAAPSGLTISSIMVAEGQPACVLGLVSPNSDFWDTLQDAGAFVVHLLESRHRRLAEIFAGQTPAPGGIFANLPTEPSEWGPKLAEVPNRGCCRLESVQETGYHGLVRGAIEAVELAALEEPLAYFQGRYRALQPRRFT